MMQDNKEADINMNIRDEFFRDSKTFMRLLGSELHEYTGDPDTTFQRDCIMFLNGRYMILNKAMRLFENSGFGIDQAAYNLGSAFASMLYEQVKMSEEIENDLPADALEVGSDLFKENIIQGFVDKLELLNNNTPVPNVPASTSIQ
jgi:hypothetical protein